MYAAFAQPEELAGLVFELGPHGLYVVPYLRLCRSSSLRDQ